MLLEQTTLKPFDLTNDTAIRELTDVELDAVAGGPLPVIIIKVAVKATLLGSASCSVTIK